MLLNFGMRSSNVRWWWLGKHRGFLNKHGVKSHLSYSGPTGTCAESQTSSNAKPAPMSVRLAAGN